MVDPTVVTIYDRDEYQLQEFALFTILVAGKRARLMARSLDALLREGHWINCIEQFRPFEAIRAFPRDILSIRMKSHGIGCHTIKAKAILGLLDANLDLDTCTTDEMEQVYGIGPKTSRYFMLHTRSGARVAALDRHMLQYLRDCGVDAPWHPPSSKRYRQLEQVVLSICDILGMTPAALDLMVWNYYSGELENASKPPLVSWS